MYEIIKQIEELGAFVQNIDNANFSLGHSFDVECTKKNFMEVAKLINKFIQKDNLQLEVNFLIL